MDDDIDGLVQAVNQTSTTARVNWIFFISLIAYLFVAVASVTHADLLLDNPIKLPLLSVEIPLSRFFTYIPLTFLLIYVSVLLQQALLASQARELNHRISNAEGEWKIYKNRRHPSRPKLSTYFLVQHLAGPVQARPVQYLTSATLWLTLGVLPVVLILLYQIVFLPYHDAMTTLWHKICVATAAIASLMLLRMLAPLPRLLSYSFLTFQSLAILFSTLVATVPGSISDRLTRASPFLTFRVPLGDATASNERRAFWPTALLFEGSVNYVTGRTNSVFSRNLVLPDVKVSSRQGTEKTAINLRNRDLRYANFDRADLRDIDFTAANLTGSRFVGANLRRSKFSCEKPGEPPNLAQEWERWRGKVQRNVEYFDTFTPDDKWSWVTTWFDDACRIEYKSGCPRLQGANFTSADLRGSDLKSAELSGVTFRSANLQGMDLAGVRACSAKFSEANLQATDLSQGTFVGASFTSARMHGAKLQDANLGLASLLFARLQGADLSRTWAPISDFRVSDLSYANLTDTVFRAADLRNVELWGAHLPVGSTMILADLSGARARPLDLSQVLGFKDKLYMPDPSEPSMGKPFEDAVTNIMRAAEAVGNAWPDEPRFQELLSALNRKSDASYSLRRANFYKEVLCRSELAAEIAFEGYDYGWGDTYYTQDTLDAAVDFEDPEILKRLMAQGRPLNIETTSKKEEEHGEPFVEDWFTVSDLYRSLTSPGCQSANTLETKSPGFLADLKVRAESFDKSKAATSSSK
jgi:uncharacterized protein YjbI with pentapeptide repeats